MTQKELEGARLIMNRAQPIGKFNIGWSIENYERTIPIMPISSVQLKFLVQYSKI